MNTQTHHILGIRHHGPGSARAVAQALAAMQPDIVLIEGPPDADGVIHWAGHDAMDPPVALLVYRPDKPEKGSYYPYATFSPEYQAMRYALSHGVPVRFMDLPLAVRFATDVRVLPPEVSVLQDLAQAAGYRSYEAWWNTAVEQRHDGPELFTAVQTLMTTLRSSAPPPTNPDEATLEKMRWAERREASMRRIIRHAIADGHRHIAVVCGAWHGPALVDLDTEADDDAALADLPTVNVKATWVPWTYGRLALQTGYGAGIQSPGWYHHLWTMSAGGASITESGIQWLARVAHLLREEDLDASSAHVIEAVRLAEALAAMRQRPYPGLTEFNEAVQTVLCAGDDAPLQLVRRKLIVGERMGMVPPGTPMIPLQRDLLAQQRRLKLRPEPEKSKLKLDLRNETHRERSRLLHRLTVLRVPWGKTQAVRGGQPGSHTELWQLQWLPDFAIRVIEAGFWGNTVAEATAVFLREQADNATDLPTLTGLLDDVILTDLPDATAHIMRRIEDTAAISSDVPHMMDALPPLARVLRYGDVRQTDQAALRQVVVGLLTRIRIGLPSTCQRLDDTAARDMLQKLTAVHSAIQTLRDDEQEAGWLKTLAKLATQPNTHGSIGGRATRLLLDAGQLSPDDTAVAFERALSPDTLAGQTPEQLAQAAHWLDGFLANSELLLVHDRQLWQLLDGWLTGLPPERFVDVLPLLRRTFSGYSEAVKRQLDERIRTGQVVETAVDPPAIDPVRADAVLPVVAHLLGLDPPRQDKPA